MKDTAKCVGCRNHAYNQGLHGIKECWSLAGAKVVTRYRIGWWTEPTQPGAFRKVKTYQCHSAPGQYADYDKIPYFAIAGVPKEGNNG